jgi:phospholipase C
MSRRGFLTLSGIAVGGGVAGYVIDRALSSDPAGQGSLSDIEHIVLFMQENRSFDHYFGTLSGVRGFDDPHGVFAQAGYPAAADGRLRPFPLIDPAQPERLGLLTFDPDHSWSAQHGSWGRGAMDAWMRVHVETDSAQYAPLVMGYYTRADLPVHYQLADAFTVCDHYFSSVLGQTGANRLYFMTGTLDPHGHAGGPIIGGAENLPRGSLSWRTFPENLTDAGVSWKIYNYLTPSEKSVVTGMVKYFAAYQDPSSELARRGLQPRWPDDFRRDIAAGTLPSVSWVIPRVGNSEHPSAPPAVGAQEIITVLDALTANPAIWEKTALIITYDENGGFFDHVPPPVPPPGTADEFVGKPTFATDVPIGLGFRVPCLVLSPYTRGGLICSDPFDHTSQLRLVGQRFGVPVPNLSAWRTKTVGDMTSLFGTSVAKNATVPTPPDVAAQARAALKALARSKAAPITTPLTISSTEQPRQETSPHRRRIGTTA